MNPDSFVTVLITVFNGSKTLDRCLESILAQTHRNVKVVCVNDASTDDTFEKLLLWREKFGKDRFLLLSNEKNLGVTKSSNRGLGEIDTEYTSRIDADDWWDKDKLAKQLHFFKDNPDYGIIGCNYINFNKTLRNKVVTPKEDETTKKILIKRNPFAHSCVIYKTVLAKKIGGYNESIKYGGDYELYLRFYPKTKFHNIQEFLCFRSIESEGISITKQREQMLQGVKTKIKYIQMYHLPKINYIYLTELFVVAFTPKIIRDFKRALFG